MKNGSTSGRPGPQLSQSQSRRLRPISQVKKTDQILIAEAQGKLELMFIDLNYLWQNGIKGHEKSVDWKSIDPFRTVAIWKQRTRDRFQYAGTCLGREFAVVSLWAQTFADSMDQDKDVEWRALVERVGNVKESLRMFAITRGIRYARLYELSSMPQELGPLDNELSRADAPVQWWGFSHPHLFYRNFEGNIREARFVQGKYNNAMAHTNGNIYHPQRLMIPPERPKAWPKAWKWPTNPQCANEIPEQPPFGACHWCNKDIISCEVLRNQNPHCECKRDSYEETPLVEICQFQNYERDPFMGINRGVIALSPIKKGDIIGEYVGTFTNRRNKVEKDNTYLFDFPGPLVQNEDLSWAPSVRPTCNLSAAEAGNWTRFVNAGMDSTEENVEFQAQGIGGKLRIIVKATKNIRFGEELLTNYGEEYFKRPKRKLDEDELDEDYVPSSKRRRTR